MCRLLRIISNLINRGTFPVWMASSSSAKDDSQSDEISSDEALINPKPVNETPDEELGSPEHDDKKTKKSLDFDKMPLNEKRSYYRCGKSFVTMDRVLSWPEYVRENYHLFIKKGFLSRNSKLSSENDDINGKVSLWQGDITCLEIDAIVNAANKSLRGGGGVDGCIHRAAGRGLLEECIKLKGCETGCAKITSGHKLPAKKVIHTVGPVGEKKKKLQNCYENCLRLVKEHNLRTIAFCCISTGIYGYPNDKAAVVALETVAKWLEKDKNSVDRVIFCVFLETDLEIYSKLMLKYFPCTVTPDDPSDTKEEELPKTDEDNKIEGDMEDERKGKEQPTILGKRSPEGSALPALQGATDAQSTALEANVPVKDDVDSTSLKSPSEDTGDETVRCADPEVRHAGAIAAQCPGSSDATQTTEKDEVVKENSLKSGDEEEESRDAGQKRKKRKQDDGDEGMDVDGETHEDENKIGMELGSNEHEAENGKDTKQPDGDCTGITVDEECRK